MPEISPIIAGAGCVLLAVVGWIIGVNGGIIASIVSVALCVAMVYLTMEFNAIFYFGMLLSNVAGLFAGWSVYLIYNVWKYGIDWEDFNIIKWLLPS